MKFFGNPFLKLNVMVSGKHESWTQFMKLDSDKDRLVFIIQFVEILIMLRVRDIELRRMTRKTRYNKQ